MDSVYVCGFEMILNGIDDAIIDDFWGLVSNSHGCLWMGNAAFHVVLMWVCMYGFLNQDFQNWDDAGESLVGP